MNLYSLSVTALGREMRKCWALLGIPTALLQIPTAVLLIHMALCGNTHMSFANTQFFLRGKTESRSNVVLIAAEFVSAVGDSARKREARHAFVRPNELVKPF